MTTLSFRFRKLGQKLFYLKKCNSVQGCLSLIWCWWGFASSWWNRKWCPESMSDVCSSCPYGGHYHKEKGFWVKVSALIHPSIYVSGHSGRKLSRVFRTSFSPAPSREQQGAPTPAVICNPSRESRTYTGASPRWTCLEHLYREVSWRHPDHDSWIMKMHRTLQKY